jgi:hypothetical protein
VEAKLLQTAASLRTFFVLVISAEPVKSLVGFLGVFLSARYQNTEQNLSFHAVFRGQWLRELFDTSLNCSLAGQWFRLGAWTLDSGSNGQGMENVVYRQSMLLSPGDFDGFCRSPNPATLFVLRL